MKSSNSLATKNPFTATALVDPYWTVAMIRTYFAWSDRAFRRALSAGRFPREDLRIGRNLRWKESTVRAWEAARARGNWK